MIKDYFKLAIKNIKKRKLRSWLTLIGIFISVAVIFILISLSLGLQSAITEQFELLGTDKFFIQARGSFGPPGSGGAVNLDVGDFETIEKVSGVKQASYMTIGNAEIKFHDQTRYFIIVGVSENGMDLYMESGSIKILEGKNIEDSGINKILIGYDYKFNEVFSRPIEVGDKMLINNQEFKVQGIMDRIGNPQDDKNLIININDFRNLFNSGDRVDYIIIQVAAGEDLKEVADRVEKRLMKFRDVTEKTIDFTILTPEELLSSFQIILTVITSFLASVAAISLLVGAIGISNTMYTSVLERTKEIGVMKAIGAKNSDILLIFVIEAGLIGMLGGLLGVLLGIGVSKTVEYIAINQLNTTLLKAATPLYLIFGCILFAFLIGAISGFMPARQASKIKVVDALRYE